MSLQYFPQSGPVGTPVTLVLSNTGAFINSVVFNGVPAPFTTDGSGVVNTSVPAGATSGFIRVNFFGGGFENSSGSFTVTGTPVPMVPTINSISPTTGGGGTLVTLAGSNLGGTNSATINNVPCLLQSVLASQVIVSMPGNGTSGPIVLSGSNGSASSPNFIYALNSNAPQVTSFTPTSGPVGTEVTLTGLRFGSATQVLFNGTPASFSILGETQIKAMAPANASTGRISVVNSFGAGTSSTNFTYTNLVGIPVLSSFSPTSGKAGDLITLNGLNLGALTQVLFNGVSASFMLSSGTQVTTVVPIGATTGPITLVNAAGQVMSGTLFTVTTPAPLPMVSFFNPASGREGDPVQINGTGFNGATSVVFAGGRPVSSFTVSNGTIIFTTVPTGAQSGPVTITTPAGSGTSGIPFTVNGPVPPPPTISSFSPAQGGAGLPVDILGSNFAQITSVQFGGVPATYTFMDAGRIRASVPSNALSGPITVITVGGIATSSTPFTFIALTPSPPVIFDFSPISGPVDTEVTLTGNHLGTVTSVRLGGVACAVVTQLNELIKCKVPAGVKVGTFSVTGPGGTATSTSSFSVTGGTVPPPSGGGGGKVKFNRVTAANGSFPNELPPKFTMELGIDDAGKVRMVAGQEIRLTFVAFRDDLVADTVQLSLSELVTNAFTARLSTTVVSTFEPFDIIITAPPSSSGTLGNEFSLNGIGTVPPPLNYIPFSIRVEVLRAVEAISITNPVILSRNGKNEFMLGVLRRRFLSTSPPVLENLPADVTLDGLPMLQLTRNATESEGGGVIDQYKAKILGGPNAIAAQYNIRVKSVTEGGTPAGVPSNSALVSLNVLQGELSIQVVGPSSRDVAPGQSDNIQIGFTSVSFVGTAKVEATFNLVSGNGGVRPSFGTSYDPEAMYLPGVRRDAFISISAPQDATTPASYRIDVMISSFNDVPLNMASFVVNVASSKVFLEPQFPTTFSLYPSELRLFNATLSRSPNFNDPVKIAASGLPSNTSFSTLPNPVGVADVIVSLRFQADRIRRPGSEDSFTLRPTLNATGSPVGPPVTLTLKRLPFNLAPIPESDSITLFAGKSNRFDVQLSGVSFLAPDDSLVMKFDPIKALSFASQQIPISPGPDRIITVSVDLPPLTRPGTYTTNIFFSLSSGTSPRQLTLPKTPVTFVVENSATI
jgi:hypothetical protein